MLGERKEIGGRIGRSSFDGSDLTAVRPTEPVALEYNFRLGDWRVQ